MTEPTGNEICPNESQYRTHGVSPLARTYEERDNITWVLGTCARCKQPVEARFDIDDYWTLTTYLIHEETELCDLPT